MNSQRRARKWLHDALRLGPIPEPELVREASEQAIDFPTLYRAMCTLPGTHWEWIGGQRVWSLQFLPDLRS